MNKQDQMYTLYVQAKKNMEANDPSTLDELIVALWEMNAKQQQTIVDQGRRIEILEANVARNNDAIIGEHNEAVDLVAMEETLKQFRLH